MTFELYAKKLEKNDTKKNTSAHYIRKDLKHKPKFYKML